MRRGFEQNLFEHTMVELDALLSLLPTLKKPNYFNLGGEEEKILIASVIANAVGKERQKWYNYILGKKAIKRKL